MVHALKQSWPMTSANGVGAVLYLAIAVRTWNVDFALGGLFWEVAVLRLGLIVFTVVNLAWLVLVMRSTRRSTRGRAVLVWASVMAIWTVTIGFDVYMTHVSGREAQELLR